MNKSALLKIASIAFGSITLLTLALEHINWLSDLGILYLINIPGYIVYFFSSGDIHFANTGATSSLIITIVGSSLAYTILGYLIVKGPKGE